MNIGKSEREVNRPYLWISSIPLYGLPAFLDPDPDSPSALSRKKSNIKLGQRYGKFLFYRRRRVKKET